MLADSGLHHWLWEDALKHAAFIRNRIPKAESSVTPHERIFGRKPDLSKIPIFGQAVVARIPPEIRRKNLRFTDPRGELGAFVGCNDTIKGFQVHIPGPSRSVIESRDVRVLDRMLHELNPVEEDEDLGDATGDDDSDVEDSSAVDTADPAPSELTAARRSKRIAQRSEGQAHAFSVLAEVIREPMNLAEAKRSPQWPRWEQAIREEIEALFENGTFEWVDPPPDAKILDHTFQFRLKLGSDGDIARFKARLCARGDKQEFILHFLDTYAPVAALVTVRIFLAIVVRLELHVRHGDVPSAYVKADLVEEIYMRPVPGFSDVNHSGRAKRCMDFVKRVDNGTRKSMVSSGSMGSRHRAQTRVCTLLM